MTTTLLNIFFERADFLSVVIVPDFLSHDSTSKLEAEHKRSSKDADFLKGLFLRRGESIYPAIPGVLVRFLFFEVRLALRPQHLNNWSDMSAQQCRDEHRCSI